MWRRTITAILFVIGYVYCNPNNYQNLQLRCTLDSCTKSGAKMQNIIPYFVPNPPEVGKPLKLYLDGVITEKVTSGSLDVEGNIEHYPPFKENYDLCYIMESELHTECPLLPGKAHYEYETKLPRAIIPGNYNGVVRAMNQNNNELFCLKANCTIRPT